MGEPHTLAGSVEELISRESLTRLSGRRVSEVHLLPFTSVDGRSGIELEAVEAAGAGRYILKRFSCETDVVMRVTHDRAGRAVEIWRTGLLDRLPPQIVHGVVGCARDGEGWAILLTDFSGSLLPADEQRQSEEDDAAVLDALAAMHATFWAAPPDSETYGLCPLRIRYECLFPARLQRESGPDAPPIVPFALEGWEVFFDLAPPDITELVRALHKDMTPFMRALDRYPHTLLHGDWHHGNLGLIPGSPPGVIVLDWAFVSAGPPAVDLAEYLFIGVMRLPSTKEATIERYRRSLAARLDSRFAESWWEPQLELALLGEFLQLAWNKAHVVVHGETEAIRERERGEIAWWYEHVRRAAEWL